MLAEGVTTVMISWGPNQNPSPKLLVYDPTHNVHRYVDVSPGTSIDAEISFERVCTGRFDGPNSLVGCPESRSIESGSQCEECQRADFYWPLRAEYHGLRNRNEHFGQPHVVYIAAFGSIQKVGITHYERFPTRVVEQGADAAAIVCSASNADEALHIESEIAQQTSITDQVTKEEKIKVVREDVTEGLISRARNEIERTLDIDVATSQEHDLTRYYPGIDSIDQRCSLFTKERINAEITCLKGQILYLSSGQALSVPLVAGRLTRKREQMGLGTFQ